MLNKQQKRAWIDMGYGGGGDDGGTMVATRLVVANFWLFFSDYFKKMTPYSGKNCRHHGATITSHHHHYHHSPCQLSSFLLFILNALTFPCKCSYYTYHRALERLYKDYDIDSDIYWAKWEIISGCEGEGGRLKHSWEFLRFPRVNTSQIFEIHSK